MYLFLSQQESEWQENSIVDLSGSPRHIITDARSGRQLCLESALSQRFLEASELESYKNGLLSINEIADIIFSRRVVVEDVNSTIAGLWDITQKKRISVFQGFQQGFTDRVTALQLLESQACTGGICDPSSGEKVTLLEALKRGLVDEAVKKQLQQFEQAFNGITHSKTGKVLSVFEAVQENLLPKDVGFRCIEFQLFTGGVIHPGTHDRVSLEEVIQRGLVDKVTAAMLKDEKLHTKSLTCPKTKRKITFKEALERSVFDCHTGLRLLEATKVLSYGAKTAFHYLMTEEDREKTQKQLKALSQAYSELSQHCSDQTTSADEVGLYRRFVKLCLLQLCAIMQTVPTDVQLHDLFFFLRTVPFASPVLLS
uniref:Uncharacterized protein n=1 Tax=Kryptolebias marmoratus TaxID=37003 RepID=A0A3Q3BCB2_KRYMA